MSYAAERWARSQTVGHSTAKAVLRELAFYHNGLTGLCCPSVSKIARVLEVKKADTITAAIRRLEEGGFISREFVRDPESGQILRTEYALIGFVASEWGHPKNQDTSPEYQDTSPENWGTVPQKTRGGSPEKRGEGSPKNRDVTGNKNLELEQGKVTRDIGAPASDHFRDVTKKVKEPKPKRSRAKPKTQCPFSPDEQIPDDFLAYAMDKHPGIDAVKEFTKFVNSAYANGRKYSDWKAAWRTWTANAEDWKPRAAYTPPKNNKPLIFDDAYYGDGSF